MPRRLHPVRQDTATDWDGSILPREITTHLFPSCIVRAIIQNTNGNAEALYFRITKIKDGTFWGICQDTYRSEDWVGLPDGKTMTFRREDINEIPLEWQPKRFQKAVGGLATRGGGKAYAITGLRGAGL